MGKAMFSPLNFGNLMQVEVEERDKECISYRAEDDKVMLRSKVVVDDSRSSGNTKLSEPMQPAQNQGLQYCNSIYQLAD